MKIAVITDPHFISPDEPHLEKRNKRLFFADAWPSFDRLRAKLRLEAPELVICLGDMVDWYSKANRDFAVYQLNQLPCPWVSVPGNHDYQSFAEHDGEYRSVPPHEGRAEVSKGWLEQGIELHNRYIDAGDTGLILLDSALSEVPLGTKDWLRSLQGRHRRQLLFTHVPLDLPATREYILSIDPERNMGKYVQSKAPWVARECEKLGVSHVFTGHLHFQGELQAAGMRMHLLSKAITGLRQPVLHAEALILELGDTVSTRRIVLEA
ncbi:metallophosphoesterase family protein [Paenibacillus cremeus]|nr:metallophosphoesterase [Paenibacillus cremeus]